MKLINLNIYQLVELASDKKVVCFGAGRMLANFISRYPQLKLENLIYRVVDSSPEKIGTFFSVNNKKIPIISEQELRMQDGIVMLITCRDVVGVYEQLKCHQELRDVLCCASCYIDSETNLLIETERIYPAKYRLTSEQKIPKKIHYCWFGGNPIPDKNKRWMESWRKYCPDYEIIEWNEDNYDLTKNQYMYEAYQQKKWGFVPDYARLDIIHEHGGIYLDTDVELIRPIDDLLYQSAFAGIDFTKLVSLGLGFGAEAKSPVINKLREEYEPLRFVNEDGSLNLIAAPKVQQKSFEQLGYVCNGDYQIIEGMTIYPEKVLSGKCNYTGRIMPTEHTYMIHHYDGSWVAKDVREAVKRRNKLFEKVQNLN